MTQSCEERRTRIAVFASGEGTTFAAVADGLRGGGANAEVSLLIVSRAGVGAASAAASRSIECTVLDEMQLGRERCDEQTLALLDARDIRLVVLAGYLRKIGPRTLAAFSGRIINTHPAPLPRFGGTGIYGEHVHAAVLASGVQTSAATIHLVDAEYDTGPVIAEQPVPVLPEDDVPSLRTRVQHAERELLIDTIGRLVAEKP